MKVDTITINKTEHRIYYELDDKKKMIEYKNNNEMLAFVAILVGMNIQDFDYAKQNYGLIKSGVQGEDGQWFTFHDLAEYHSTSRQTINAWIKRYKLQTKTFSGMVLINNDGKPRGYYKQTKGAKKWRVD